MTNSYDDEDGTIPLSGLDRDRVWREWGIDLQDTTRMADDPEWAQECIDWSEPPLVPPQYFPGVRGRLWERRRLARLRRSWLDDGAYGYDGPREWHPRIVGQYLSDEDVAERVHRAVPAIGVALLIGAGVLMGRMLS